jgi:mRNA interferase MazF
MVVKRQYVPERGDLVWLDFEPHAGHEQAGRRPALALSPKYYNQKTGLGIFCPITSQIKEFPFEVALPPGLKVTGAVLADHLKNVDWRARRAEYVDRAPAETIDEVLQKIAVLFGVDSWD